MKQHNLLLHWAMHVLSSDESILASDFVLTQYTFFWKIKANIDLIKRLKLYNSIIALFNLLLYCCCTPSRSTFTCVLAYKRKILNLKLYFFVILYTYTYICNG